MEVRQFVETKKKEFHEKKKMREERKLQENTKKEKEKFDILLHLLAAPDLELINAMAMVTSADQDQMLEMVVRVFDAKSLTINLLKQVISREVEATASPSTLFRGNSCATKLMTSYTKLTGKIYLYNTLSPVLQQLFLTPQNLEVDPTRAKGINIQQNMVKLINMSQTFLNAILSSLKECPYSFHIIAKELFNEAGKRFADSKRKAVAGFIFLRFFCPAISGPDTCGLADGLQPDVRRALVLISKAIQNLANGVQFGSKEQYMANMNEFIVNNRERVDEFLDKLTEVPDHYDPKPLSTEESCHKYELPELNRILIENLEAIGRALYKNGQDNLVPQVASALAQISDYDEAHPQVYPRHINTTHKTNRNLSPQLSPPIPRNRGVTNAVNQN